MTEWTHEAEQMFKTWTDTQKKVWDSWVESVQGSNLQSDGADLWLKMVETWETAVKNSMDAQKEWTELWAEAVKKTDNVPKEVAEWVAQNQEMTKEWSDAQQKLFASWFELAKEVVPSKAIGNWQRESEKAFASWQESVRKIMDAQKKWTTAFGSENDEQKTTARKTKTAV